ncbi:MotA/TolQ/ExbB proton channel family protein [Methylomarinum vadi]|uniref:MotA/TolQ/ExbB proton channel family protein n=1 Tax=Methylomarinum vadi TaxID=438855 RepID=UPI0004DED855|nr:MotA/TolQ/ExbB proton channel family protein [Methylomarinum vadi]
MAILDSIEDLLSAGGDVLWLILCASVCLWGLISERLIYFKIVYPDLQCHWLEQWRQRNHCSPRVAFHIRRGILSEAKISMEQYMAVIKMLIAICPMLGLLGTVTGMIQVFDVMAVTGSSNARSMAAGISQATISTMAGMMVAISGLYFHKLIEKSIHDRFQHLAHLLKQH